MFLFCSFLRDKVEERPVHSILSEEVANQEEGIDFDRSQGVAQETAMEGERWLELAAKHGHIGCQAHLSQQYLAPFFACGNSMDRLSGDDRVRALRGWEMLKAAAKGGDVVSGYNWCVAVESGHVPDSLCTGMEKGNPTEWRWKESLRTLARTTDPYILEALSKENLKSSIVYSEEPLQAKELNTYEGSALSQAMWRLANYYTDGYLL